MSCSNNCPGSCSLGALRHPCHVPLTSSANLCPSDVSCGNVYCLPGGCQDRPWLAENRQEAFGEATSCQPVHYEPSAWEASCIPPAACYVPRPCQGPSFVPTAPYVSSPCVPITLKPLSYVPGSCRPQSVVMYGYGPAGYLPCRPQSIGIVSGGLRPVRPLSSGCQPVTPVFGTCRPSCSAMGGQ
ncbi:PREDICTED: keratin-associated protein 26-1-like [Condylura cristata]|uniref:keratin-associated protein 26-1-like n=1 Tax=Condylura cristata TaxID=143302 RepID=UPI0003343B5F|nr:PREDICTED: keratin-associated protein 26-1-like [Condylura cristata]